MTTKNFFTVILILLMNRMLSHAQNTEPRLTVIQEEETNPAPLLRKLNNMSPDTNQVKLLLKTSHIYWHRQKISGPALDTCMTMAKKAYELSYSLKYVNGTNEAAFMLCKTYMLRNRPEMVGGFLNRTFGEEKIRLLLVMAEHYTAEMASDPKELEKAYPLIAEATSLSAKIRSDRCLNECRMLLSGFYLSKGEISQARKILLDNINALHKKRDYAAEARNWSFIAHQFPENEDSYPFIIHCHEMAINRYFMTGDKKSAGYGLRDLAVVNANHNRTELAGKQFREMLSVFESIHEKISRRTYYLIAEYYRFTAQYHQALRFALKALQTPEAYDERRMMVYRSLGETYAALGDYQKGLKYYQILLDFQLAQKSGIAYVSAYRMAHIESEGGKPREALSSLNRYIRFHPPQNLSQKQLFYSSYGDLYRLIGDYYKAEAYYKKMLAIDNAVKIENGKYLHGHEINVTGSGALYLMGRFYAERGQYKEAKKYLKQSLVNPQYFDAQQELDTYKLLFKADSAQKNYLLAIRNFERHKLMYDSINSITRNNQIAELSIRYQTEQNKKDIKLLESKQRAQQAELMRAATLRNVILGGAATLLLLAVTAFAAYRIKQRSNQKLHAQQLEINHQNRELQSLLSEKEIFLKEKDWLLKEVHHRVKNNLQIVMSLLSTQSFYMQNDHAREAILQSENRVQSIALIHQKLYASDNLASIHMPAYIDDLVTHLGESFDTSTRRITFNQRIEQINIDLSQAVPVGLILNEAITNAIKYAFNKTGGEIAIVLRRIKSDDVEISISDNGKGLPRDFDVRAANSLGMEMMLGLSAQLKGTLEVSNGSGTSIRLKFQLLPKLTIV
ncbi:tetratricopeptide repeat-containing sensor histidine kinase [Mucilaginibacter psychrotolerans]|uniref:histidine kinase n=1 Tax=Mucilaginibacter psychrotolerans TaxID=1524096 RepID=A0A4Y8SGH9_9SPHI|nr:histidine kinase dimerization/phosphoacceptor domain -containing protein [Mucilaginibacter psychrotolerans]TFF37781.1 tetratricopeptide repeat protein [Mucilaginibacter psychrotolerans]